MKRTLLLITLLSAAVANGQVIFDEDSALKAAVQQHFTVHQPFYRGHVLFAAKTGRAEVPQSTVFTEAKVSDKVREQLVGDFVKRNAAARKIQFKLPRGIEAADVSQYATDGGYDVKRLHEARPEMVGIVTVSRPGFSADGSLALIRLEVAREKLTDTVAYIFARQPDGTWKIAAGVLPAESGEKVTASSASR